MRDQLESTDNQIEERGAGSFCVPRAALDALIDAQANAYEICTYLVLACFTDASGQFSTASISAVNRYTGANKVRNGPVDRAIQRLMTTRAKAIRTVTNGKAGRAAAEIKQIEDLGPILIDRSGWASAHSEPLPDGPNERAKVNFILPDFDEAISDRVWFGGNLVKGIGSFEQPLKQLKNMGDGAARLLLLLYMAHDMETWGGIRPIGEDRGPWVHYEPVSEDHDLAGHARLVRAKMGGQILPTRYFDRIATKPTANFSIKEKDDPETPTWNAMLALQSAGLLYEVVIVLNRSAVAATFNSGEKYSAISGDAEPLYELDSRTTHGLKPIGEEGIGAATAKTAGELGHPVTREGGRFDGTYAAIVPAGYPAMIVGIFRLRFRVSNLRNAGVKGAWARIHQNNRSAFEFLQRVRTSNGLPLLPTLEGQKKLRGISKPVADSDT